MGIGRKMNFDVDFLDDFSDEGPKEKKRTKAWGYGTDLQVTSVIGRIDEDSVELEIILTNKDVIEFYSYSEIGAPLPPGQKSKDTATMRIITGDNEIRNVESLYDKYMELIENGSMIIPVLQLYQELKAEEASGKIKASSIY